MATVVDRLPEMARRGRQTSQYAQYLDGRIWRLERGVDFTSSMSSINSCLRTAAVARNKKVSIRHAAGEANAIYVQARAR